MDSSFQLRVLTLNCWGLPDFLTKVVYRRYNKPQILNGRKWGKRTQRIAAIANRLDEYDVVCLEEVWIQEDQELFRIIGKEKGLLYSHVFSSGLLGSSGLQVLSRHPIQEVHFHRYRLNGQIFRVDHGDYHVGKGFGLAKILVNGTKMSIILTHTIAQYYQDDTYHPDRISQAWEMARFVQMNSRPDEPIILVGDMNCKPDSIEYNILTQLGNLKDSFQEVNPKLPGLTTIGPNQQRIDFIFYSFNKCKDWNLISSKVTLNTEILYSDHYGLSSTFSFSKGSYLNSKSKNLKNNTTNISTSFPTSTPIYSSSTHSSSTNQDESEYEDLEITHKLKKTILEQSEGVIGYGIHRAKKRKTNHFIRGWLLLLIAWFLHSIVSPSYWIGLVCIFMTFEFLLALFFVEDEITSLTQIQQELKFFLNR